MLLSYSHFFHLRLLIGVKDSGDKPIKVNQNHGEWN